jgi:hypothetical protein
MTFAEIGMSMLCMTLAEIGMSIAIRDCSMLHLD